MRTLEVEAEIPAAQDRVWSVLTDHERWPRWAGVKEVVVRRPGSPHPAGVGAARVVRVRGLAVEEEITAFEPPSRFVYRIVAGAPVRDHHAEVTLEPSGESTRVRWSVRYRPWIPGTGALVDRMLAAGLRGVLDGLPRACTQPPAAAPRAS